MEHATLNGSRPKPSRKAIVINPILKDGAESRRRPEGRLEEAVGLVEAIGMTVVHAAALRINRPVPATLVGAGILTELSERIADADVELVVIDWTLSPVQQRNLEQTLKAKAIDRTGLILEIFGQRARTREGQLQVELASLSYQRSRLVRSWTHLERQRGGFGFLGGPGETQLEIDKRLIGDRIAKIKRELDDVRRTRGLHRRSRERVPYPVVALVGYTNAGKSTLFNRMAGADVFARDMLFATLDPTMRAITLESGRTVILSDTVGFISELPTHLIAAFRATLEEVETADLILHVRDIAHPETDAQCDDVYDVLNDLGIDQDDDRLIEVLNKVDLLAPDAEVAASRSGAPADRFDGARRRVAVSALTGDGIDRLCAVMDRRLTAHRQVVNLAIASADGAALAWLHERGDVLDRSAKDGIVRMRVSLDPADIARFEHRYDYHPVDLNPFPRTVTEEINPASDRPADP